MKNTLIFYLGVLGVSLFAISSIVGGLLIEGYHVKSQFISETYAIDTEYGIFLRIFGVIPSGILISIFSFFGLKYFRPSNQLIKIGFYGLGIFYGIATVIVGCFPCDSGCNKEFINPSLSQIIHNLTGGLTYIFVPIGILLMGIGMKRFPNYNVSAIKMIIYGLISMLFVWLLFSNSNTQYIGLYQRVIETVFIIVIITCAIEIRKQVPETKAL